MYIPPEMLSARALRGVIDEFVSREGTDYGHDEWEMDDKIEQVMRLLEVGEVVILGDPESCSWNLVTVEAAEHAMAAREGWGA